MHGHQIPERRQVVYKFMLRYQEQHQRPPTVREIMVAVGISSTSQVHYNLRRLVQMGKVVIDETAARGARALPSKVQIPAATLLRYVPLYEQWPFAEWVVAIRPEPENRRIVYYYDEAFVEDDGRTLSVFY